MKTEQTGKPGMYPSPNARSFANMNIVAYFQPHHILIAIEKESDRNYHIMNDNPDRLYEVLKHLEPILYAEPSATTQASKRWGVMLMWATVNYTNKCFAYAGNEGELKWNLKYISERMYIQIIAALIVAVGDRHRISPAELKLLTLIVKNAKYPYDSEQDLCRMSALVQEMKEEIIKVDTLMRSTNSDDTPEVVRVSMLGVEDALGNAEEDNIITSPEDDVRSSENLMLSTWVTEVNIDGLLDISEALTVNNCQLNTISKNALRHLANVYWAITHCLHCMKDLNEQLDTYTSPGVKRHSTTLVQELKEIYTHIMSFDHIYEGYSEYQVASSDAGITEELQNQFVFDVMSTLRKGNRSEDFPSHSSIKMSEITTERLEQHKLSVSLMRS
jgi:hypothetical protein